MQVLNNVYLHTGKTLNSINISHKKGHHKHDITQKVLQSKSMPAVPIITANKTGSPNELVIEMIKALMH